MIEKYLNKILPFLLFIVAVIVFSTASSFGWPDRESSIPLITSVRSHAKDLIFISVALAALGYYLYLQNRRISELQAAINKLQKKKEHGDS